MGWDWIPFTIIGKDQVNVWKDAITLASDQAKRNNEQAVNCTIKYADLFKKYDLDTKALKASNDTLNAEIQDLRNQQAAVQEQIDIRPMPPFINPNGYYLMPIQIVQVGTEVKAIHIPYRSLFASSNVLSELVTEQGWRKLDYVTACTKIASWVSGNIHYAHEDADNWQYPETTYYLRQGDCEDFAILFVELARIAGCPSDKVFMCLGDWLGQGHAFPAIQEEDGEMTFFELTTGSKDVPAQRLKGSDHHCDKGILNWRWSGSLQETMWV